MMIRKKIGSVVLLITFFLVASGTGFIYAQERKVTLNMVEWSSPAVNVEKIIKKFENQNPNIKVIPEVIPWTSLYNKVTVSLLGKAKIDLIYGAPDWMFAWAKMGFLQNLDKYKQQLDIDDFYPSVLEIATRKGSLYGIPNRFTPFATLYNKALYKKAGLDPESYPRTWEEFLGYCARLTVPEKEQYGYGLFGGVKPIAQLEQIASFIWQNEGRFLNEEGTKCLLNEKPAVEAVKFWSDLLIRWHVAPPNSIENSDEELTHVFCNQKIGIMHWGPVIFTHIEREAPALLEKDIIGTAPLPKGKQNAANVYACFLMMVKSTEYPDETFKFIKFMTSTEMLAQYCRSLPPRKSARNTPRFQTARFKPFFESGEYGRVLPYSPKIDKIARTWMAETQNILLNEKTAQEAMDDAVVEINKILAEE